MGFDRCLGWRVLGAVFTTVTFVSAAQAQTLDNFIDGAYDSGYIQNGSNIGYTLASVPGAIRSVGLSVTANPGADDARARTKTAPRNEYSVAFGPDVTGSATLAYGFSNAVPGSNALNLNLSQAPILSLDFTANDLPLNVETTIWTNGGASFKRNLLVPGGVTSAYTANFDFTGVNLTKVDAIQFKFGPTTNGDFTINKVSAVPEPASIAALGIGAFGILARKRRK